MKIKKKEKKYTKKQKERQESAFGPGFEAMANFVSGIEQEQEINIEKAKIILGEEFVRRQLEANPNASHSFHLSEPYKSMSLEELKLLKKRNLI